MSRTASRPKTAIGLAVAIWIVGTVGIRAQLPAIIDLKDPVGGESSPVVRVYGDDFGSTLGNESPSGMAFGDINGDGHDDFIIGARIASALGRTGSGEAYVVYGRPGIDSLAVDLDTGGLTTIHNETRLLGAEANERSGFSVASGDFDGDGFDDIVVAGRWASPGGRERAGIVRIIHGGRDLEGAIIDLADGALPSVQRATILQGDDPFDHFGYALASGELNGDGYDDLIIGAPGPVNPDGSRPGTVYIVFGGPELTGSTLDFSQAPGSNGELRLTGLDNSGTTGASLASGDINGDGFDDVIVGAPRNSVPGAPGGGQVHIFYGRADLAPGVVSLSDPGITQVLGADGGDELGINVRSGDFDGDGFDDLIIGAWLADSVTPSDPNSGEVYVVHGAEALPGMTIDLGAPLFSNGETLIVGTGIERRMGAGVDASDVNGDGYDDIVFGAPDLVRSSTLETGSIFVVYGGPALRSTMIDVSAGEADVHLLGVAASDVFGFGALGGGDFNADGFAEFAGSAFQGENPSGPPDNKQGYAAVALGDGITTSALTTERFKPGFAPRRAMGGRLSPVMRTWIEFDGGDDGSGGPTPATAEIVRGDTGIGGLANAADVLWRVSTDRVGVSTTELTFQYLDSEIAGLGEATLRLYQAASPAGPWSLVAIVQSLDMVRNEVTGRFADRMDYFAIAGIPSNLLIPPIVADPGDIIIGDLETSTRFATASATGHNVFVFPDAIDLALLGQDESTTDDQIKWSFTGGEGRIVIDGVEPLDMMLAGLNEDDPTSPRASSRIDLADADPESLDSDPRTVTFRNAELSPIGGENLDPGVDGIVTSQTTVITLFASDCTTFSARSIVVFTANNTSDGISRDGFERVESADFAATGDSLGWIGGAMPGFGGSVDSGPSGICMTVPGPGDNFVLWVSPDRFVELADNTVYRVRVAVTTDQSNLGAIPLWYFVYDNFNSDPALSMNAYGGEMWVLDVDGGAQGIGRANGRSSFDFVFAPNAIQTPQWRTAAFTPAADAGNDARIQFRIIDANADLVSDADLGTICVQSIEVQSISRESLAVASVESNTPLSSTTHFAGTISETGQGTATINEAEASMTLRVNTTGDNRLTIGPFDSTMSNLNTQLFPVRWEADTLYRMRTRIKAEASEDDPVDAIFLAFDTTTSELGAIHFTTRAAAGSPLERAASPKLTAAEYEAYMYSQNATASITPDADRLRGLAFFFNTTDLFGDGTGGDALVVESLDVDKLIVP